MIRIIYILKFLKYCNNYSSRIDWQYFPPGIYMIYTHKRRIIIRKYKIFDDEKVLKDDDLEYLINV